MRTNGNLENLVNLASKSDANVLITGPTGSGKTRLAREIHASGLRRHKPFITVNLASLHEGTLESELFGHEKGAYTGAESRRVGRLELANGGTVFLDEIGELTPRLQARLLEFMQSRLISPVGSSREIKLDVRVIAATHRCLEDCVANGVFREDLFHRIRVIPIELLPLNERWEEFDRIIHDCLEEVCRSTGRTVLRISEEVAQKLETYEWPGNFRELRNVLEFAALACEGPEISNRDLPPWFGQHARLKLETGVNGRVLGVAELPLSLDFNTALSDFEKEYFYRALHRFRGRINHTARQIGMNKTTFIRRIRSHGLAEQFRPEKMAN